MLSQPTGRLDSWPPSFVERSACSSAKRASKAFTSSGVISSKAGNQGKIEVLMGQYWKVMGKSMTGWWCNNHLEKDEWKMIETTNQMINGVYSWDNHHRTIFFGSKSRNFPAGAMFDWQVWEISWDPNELFEDWQLTVEYIWTNHFQEKEVEHSIRLCCQYRIWMIFQDIWGCLPTTFFFFTKDHHPKHQAFRTDHQDTAPSQNEVYPQRITMKEWGHIIYMAVCQNLVPL